MVFTRYATSQGMSLFLAVIGLFAGTSSVEMFLYLCFPAILRAPRRAGWLNAQASSRSLTGCLGVKPFMGCC